MTVIFGTLKDVGGQLAQGTVTVSSLVTRPAHGDASTVITKERHVLPLRNGAFESPDLDPGPVLIEAASGGAFESWEVTLPEDGRHDLATLIEMHVDYSPAVVGRVEAAAADANRAAQAAGQSATRAGEAEARVVQVVADGAAAVRAELQSEIAGVDQARVDAQSAQAAAGDAASRAEVAAGDAAASAEAAAVDAAEVGEAREYVSWVHESLLPGGATTAALEYIVQQAEQSSIAAAGSATAAQSSADSAQGSATAAAADADRAEAAAASAAADAGRAEDAADRAVDARDGAEAARDEAVQAAASATTSAPAEGWPRESLSPDVQDSLSRADTALQSVPTTVPSGEEMAALWDALQSMDMITVDTSEYGAFQELANLVEERGLTKEEVAYPTFGVRLTGAGTADSLFQGWSALVRAPKVTGSSQVTNMDRMFSGCASLTTIPALDTSQVTVMYAMFSGCASLTTLPALDTSKVEDMGQMFYRCASLTTLPALDTSQVTNMGIMFSGCASLTTIPALDTSQVTGMSDMFSGCASLESVTLPGMGHGFTANRTLDMRDTKLNAAAANALMESLGTPTPGGKLQLPATAAGADTSIATAKNWTATVR